MKNLSVVFNVVLLIAVGILYYLHFKKPAEEVNGMALPVSASGAVPSIVYVNMDSVLNNYTYYKTKKDEFEAKRKRLHDELMKESDKLQSDYAEAQQKAILMTESEKQKAAEEFMKRQNDLEEKQSKMQDNFDNEQIKFSDELHGKITALAKKLNKDNRFSYILTYQKGGGILLANDSLDMTKAMIEALNKKE